METKNPICKVEIKFLGGIGNDETKNLTGSCSMLTLTYKNGDKKRVLVDIGLYQHKETQINNSLNFDPCTIDAVVITHGHSDHIGRLPLLFNDKNKFIGNIYTTPITKKIIKLSLTDSARIYNSTWEKEERLYNAQIEFFKKIRRMLKQNKKTGIKRCRKGNRIGESSVDSKKLLESAQILLESAQIHCESDIYIKVTKPKPPLYTISDVNLAIDTITEIETRNPKNIFDGISIEFYNAGHIAGSAGVLFKIKMNSRKTKTIFFSGDIGSYKRPIAPFGYPEIPKDPIDRLIMETTYGNQVRKDYNAGLAEFEASVIKASQRKNKLIIPCFALDRVQMALYHICKMKTEGKINCPVYLDSPLSSEYTRIYRKSAEPNTISEYMDPGVKTFQILTPETREQTLLDNNFSIILTSSGMGTGGPIMLYLEKYLNNAYTSFYFMGYMAKDTLGRKLAVKQVKEICLSENTTPIEVKARVKQFTFLSGHADQHDLLKYLESFSIKELGKIFLNHGERTISSLEFSHFLERKGIKTKNRVFIPDIGQVYDI